MNFKRIYIISIFFCISLVLFADDAVQDTNYYNLKVIVDGINRIEGKLLTIAVPKEKYKADGNFKGRADISDVDNYTMEFVIDSLQQGEYVLFSTVILNDDLRTFYILDYQYAFSRINDKELDIDVKHGKPEAIWPAFEDFKISIPETKVIRLILSNNKPK